MDTDDSKVPEEDPFTDYILSGDLSECSSSAQQTLQQLPQDFDVHAHAPPTIED